MVTVWWSAAHLIHYSFLDPSKSLYLWGTFSKSLSQWDTLKTAAPVAAIGQQKGHNSSPQHHPTACHTTISKAERSGLQNFISFHIFIWPLANRLLLLQASPQCFAGKMLRQPAGVRKCFTRVRWILKHRFFHYRNKQTYFLLSKMCWL